MSPVSWRARLAEASLALRIAASVAVFGLLVAAAAAVSAYWALAHELDGRAAAELQGKRELLLHVLSEIPSVDAVPDNGHRFADLLIGHDDLHFAVIDQRDGRVLASYSRLALDSVPRFAAGLGGTVTRWQGSDGKHYASLAGTGTVHDGRAVQFVLSLDLKADRALLRGFVGATSLALPVLLVLVTLGAWAVARTGLAPLQHFTRIASTITARSLAQRIGAQSLPAELRDLAIHFNAMLDRIDEGLHRLHEFSGDLAHEMRTPVATLLGRTQVALAKDRSSEELRDVLAGNVDELDRLTRLIADMLFLARADQGAAVLDRSEIDLTDEVHRVAGFLSLVAEDRGIRVEISDEAHGQTRVQADRILVQRALTNLLTNAIRHAAAPGVVSVAIRRDSGKAFVAVSNRGEAIPAHQIGRIFERFVRLDPSRARSEGGTGLGLAIVRSIMRAHAGSVHAASEDCGLTVFTLSFPQGGFDTSGLAY